MSIIIRKCIFKQYTNSLPETGFEPMSPSLDHYMLPSHKTYFEKLNLIMGDAERYRKLERWYNSVQTERIVST